MGNKRLLNVKADDIYLPLIDDFSPVEDNNKVGFETPRSVVMKGSIIWPISNALHDDSGLESREKGRRDPLP
jgi:hypothetical protein